VSLIMKISNLFETVHSKLLKLSFNTNQALNQRTEQTLTKKKKINNSSASQKFSLFSNSIFTKHSSKLKSLKDSHVRKRRKLRTSFE
jgi:hypothetical protein